MVTKEKIIQKSGEKIIDTGIDVWNYLTQGNKPKLSPAQLSKGRGTTTATTKFIPRDVSIPYRNPDLYQKPDDVFQAFVEGKLYGKDAGLILGEKFKIPNIIYKSAQFGGESGKRINSTTFNNLIKNYLNNNPEANKIYKKMHLTDVINPATNKVATAQTKFFVNNILKKATDKNYMAEFPEIQKMNPDESFIFKYINAYKEATLGKNANMTQGFPTGFMSTKALAKEMAHQQGLNVNFAMPGKAYKYSRDGTKFLPNPNVKMTNQEFLAQFNVGEWIRGSGANLSSLRKAIRGNNNNNFEFIKKTFEQGTPGISEKINQIKSISTTRSPYSLDHIIPQRFGGQNDSSNLRYIVQGSHISIGDLPKGASFVDDIIKTKTGMENFAYNNSIKIIDLINKGGKENLALADKLASEIMVMVKNFKKVNPNIDFGFGQPFIPIRTKTGIEYVPYANYLKLDINKMKQIEELLPFYQNMPNKGDDLLSSFNKMYDRFAPFIAEGVPIKDVMKLAEETMKRGGAVGYAAGGPVPTEPVKQEPTKEEEFIASASEAIPSFYERAKEQFFNPPKLSEVMDVASNEPIPTLKEMGWGATPEAIIDGSNLVRLQFVEDFIKDKKSKYVNQADNENLSLDTQSYLVSKNTVNDYENRFRKLYGAAKICGMSPDSPGCSDFFPDGMFNGKKLSRNTEYEVIDFFENFKNTNEDYLMHTARARGDDSIIQGASDAKNKAIKETLTNTITRLPLDGADLIFDMYQELTPWGIIAGQTKIIGETQKGDSITKDEFREWLEQTNPELSEGYIDNIMEAAMIPFADGKEGERFVGGFRGEMVNEFGRDVFYPHIYGQETVRGRKSTWKERATRLGFSALGFASLFGKIGYINRVNQVLKQKDIGTLAKSLKLTPRLLGMPTVKDLQALLKMTLSGAWKGIKAPVTIPVGAGRYMTATIKPGTENVWIVGNKTLPQLGLELPAAEIAKRVALQNVIKNANLILNEIQDGLVQEQKDIDEAEYNKNIIDEALNPKYTDQIQHFYKDSLRVLLADPEVILGEGEDLDELQNLSFDPDETPAWVIRYAKKLANDYIEKNNLKRSTIGDTLFYDMLNKDEEPVDIIEDAEPAKMAVGGDPGQFSDPLRLGDDDLVNIDEYIQSGPYEAVEDLDIFEEANLKPQKQSIFDDDASYEVAQAKIFGKVPGWAIAGVDKVDELLRGSGKVSQRIAQGDALADEAVSAGEKINRFYSGLEARLIDPNTPKLFNGPEDLYKWLQSKGISKLEIEDYQIPQLLTTLIKTGKPITKEALLARIKEAPIRNLETTVRGFRSEIENADQAFKNAKYGDQYLEKGYIPETYRENIIFINPKNIPDDISKYKYSTHGFFPDDEVQYVIGWSRGTDRYAIIPGTKGQLINIGPKEAELNKKIERLIKIANRSAEDIVNQSGGRISLEQARKNIDQAKKQLTKSQDELSNLGKTDEVVTGDKTVRVTFADEIQSDIMQTYRKHLEQVKNDYQKLIDKKIDIKDLRKVRQEGYNLKSDQDVLAFYAQHNDLMRPIFRTAEDFAAYVDDIRASQQVFKDFAKIRPGMLTKEAMVGVRSAAQKRDKVLKIFEKAFTDPKTMEKLFPNVPFKDRKLWGDAIIKNDLHMAASRKFIQKDPNASDWYVISPADLITKRYGQSGTTATPYAERTKSMKGIGQYEFYGGPNVTDPSGKHYKGVLEDILRRAAKINNTEFKIVKVQVGEPKFMQRAVQVIDAQGDVVKEFKMPKKISGENVFSEFMAKAQKYIEESGAQGLTTRPIEIPSGFKTVDAYAIKLSPEMVMPTKTHLASGGYVRYDPLVSIDEMIGAA
jgi:hypothetical protein